MEGNFQQFLKKAEQIVSEHKAQYKNVYTMKGGWTPIRDTLETAGDLAGNYYLPGSSLVTNHIVSKGSQKQLNSPLGQAAQMATGFTGGGVGSGVTGIPSASEVGGGWENALNGAGNLFGSPEAGTNLMNGASNAAHSVGNFLGNNVTSPVSSLFGGSNTGAATPGASMFSDSNPNSVSNLFSSAAGNAGIPGGTSAATSSPLTNLALQGDNYDINTANMIKNGLDPNGSVSPLTSLVTGGSTMDNSSGTSDSSSMKSILKLLGSVGPLITALHPTTYPGTLSQPDIQNRLNQQSQQQQNNNQAFLTALNSKAAPRTQTNPNIDYYTYGSRPEQLFYDNVNPPMAFPNTNGNSQPVNFKEGGEVKHMAMGGLSGIPQNNVMANLHTHGIKTNLTPAVSQPKIKGSPLQFASGGDVSTGVSDDIPAQLSQGEYVMPADVVSALGDGSTQAGAQKLDSVRETVRKHKASALAKGKLPPKSKSPLAYATGGKK